MDKTETNTQENNSMSEPHPSDLPPDFPARCRDELEAAATTLQFSLRKRGLVEVLNDPDALEKALHGGAASEFTDLNRCVQGNDKLPSKPREERPIS